MKKCYSILLLLLFIAPIPVAISLLQWQKIKVKKEVKHRILDGIDKNQLKLLVFTPKESRTQLKWKHSKEFEFKGQMYDIVEMKVVKDSIYYWCWWDHEETHLNRQLKKIASKAFHDNPLNTQQQINILTWYLGHYYPANTDNQTNTTAKTITNNFGYLLKQYQLFLPTSSPPPLLIG